MHPQVARRPSVFFLFFLFSCFYRDADLRLGCRSGILVSDWLIVFWYFLKLKFDWFFFQLSSGSRKFKLVAETMLVLHQNRKKKQQVLHANPQDDLNCLETGSLFIRINIKDLNISRESALPAIGKQSYKRIRNKNIIVFSILIKKLNVFTFNSLYPL